jgi:Protein of unknown function (DUF2726)
MDLSVLESTQVGLMAASAVGVLALYWLWRKGQTRKLPNQAAGRPRTLDAVDTVIGWPPDATRVLTVRHQRALEVLRRALPEHMILAQVPISHFIKVPTRNSYVEWLRRVGHVCIDLMICDAASNVLAVIEVRQADKVETDRARKRHSRVERVLRAAGIPLHVWNEALLPDPAAVRKAFVPGSPEPELDNGPDTSPLEPTLYGPGRSRPRAAAESTVDVTGRNDPPRTTWFDELHATRPTQLDSVEVITHESGHASMPVGAFHPAPSGKR